MGGDSNNESFIKSNLAEPGSKKSAKKRVSWADTFSKQLEQIQTFYLDEAEKSKAKRTFFKVTRVNFINARFHHNTIIYTSKIYISSRSSRIQTSQI